MNRMAVAGLAAAMLASIVPPALAADIEFCDPIWHAASAEQRAAALAHLQRAGAVERTDRFICSSMGGEMSREPSASEMIGPRTERQSGAPPLAAFGEALCKAKHDFEIGLCGRKPQREQDTCVKVEEARYQRTQASCR